jgi:hypothetical protein
MSIMKPVLQLVVLTLLLLATEAMAAPVPSADQVLSKAKSQAAEEHKNIFLAFDASW